MYALDESCTLEVVAFWELKLQLIKIYRNIKCLVQNIPFLIVYPVISTIASYRNPITPAKNFVSKPSFYAFVLDFLVNYSRLVRKLK